MKKTKKKSKNIKLLVKIAIVLFVLLIIVGIIYLIISKKVEDTLAPPYESQDRSNKIGEIIENAKVIGWIQVEGTNIDYPIVYMTPQIAVYPDNYTWVVHRPTDGENRLVIYGHNIKNVSSQPLLTDPTHERFEQLMSFVYYDFAKDNEYITYTNEDGENEIYAIYAVSFQDASETGKSTIPKEETKAYIENAKKDSLYDYQIDVNENDTILSLLTCTRYFGSEEKTQFRIDARKLRNNENTEKYRVQKTKNHGIMN